MTSQRPKQSRPGVVRSARAQRAAPRRPQLPGPRAVAIRVLARVAATDAYLNAVLDAALDERGFDDARDAALVTELCYGATRRQLGLDAALRPRCERTLESLEDAVLAALRLGAYQLFHTRIPKHAAVGETVEALKALGLGRAGGLVNAVLRKVASAAPLPPASADDAVALAVATSHPEWLVRRWQRQFGPVRAKAMLEADNEAPAVALRANTARVSREDLLAQLRECGVSARPTALSPVGLVVESPGRVEDLYGFAEGLWQVQDEAAQLVGLYAQVPSGARVLDACAAPGGKACHLAQTNEVVALDVHPAKLAKLEAEAKRLGVAARVRAVAADAGQRLPEELGTFDAVVVDAPCSGLGTLRRHPELRYRRKEADLASLTALQRRLLEACQRAVKPGGLLVYAVCSPDAEEGANQVEQFLRSHPDFTSEPPTGLGHLPTAQGALCTLPGSEGLDGFFAARLRRLTEEGVG